MQHEHEPVFDVVRERVDYRAPDSPANLDGPVVCRMFNRAIARQRPPRYLSSDHDPLFRFHHWLAKLRILEIHEIKAIPCTPRSHALVERLIGTVRREYLDRTLFWNQTDLEGKLENYKAYYNQHRCHSGLAGATPAQGSARLFLQSQTFSHIAGGNTATRVISDPQLPHELEFATDRLGERRPMHDYAKGLTQHRASR